MHWRMVAFTVAGLLAPVILAGCKVVPMVDEAETAQAGFDATAYAAGLWTERALPHFAETAKPVGEVLPAIMADLEQAGTDFGYRPGEGSPWSFVVSGEGEVTAKNTESRAGTMVVATEGGPEATLQIGPVIRGNAVRDALPFVSFKDFVNQLEFANAGKALTALAVAGFAPVVETLAVGDRVRFTGAISLSKAGDAVLITPVTLEKVAP